MGIYSKVTTERGTEVLFTAVHATGSVDLCLTVLFAPMYVPHVYLVP